MSYFVLGVANALCIIWRAWKAVAIKCYQRNLPGPPSSSWLTGNLMQLNDADGLEFQHDIVRRYGGAAKIHGLFGEEQVYFSDPLALRQITITDQLLFPETRVFTALNKVMFGDAMSTVHGAQHRRHRKLLNPIFSDNQMQALVPIIADVTTQLVEDLEHRVSREATNVDVLDLLWRTTVETVGQAALGYSFGLIDEGTSNVNRDSVKDFFPSVDKLGIILLTLPIISNIGTPSFRRRVVDLIPSKRVQDVKRLVDIMDQNAREVLSKRKAALASGERMLSERVGKGKDIITLLLGANESISEVERLSEGEIIAQINLFLFGGSDTTAGALTRILDELAQNPHAQDKLREELVDIGADHGSISYEDLNQLKYLHAVVKETMRLYPPVNKLERTASEDRTISLHLPVEGTDGQMISQEKIKLSSLVSEIVIQTREFGGPMPACGSQRDG